MGRIGENMNFLDQLGMVIVIWLVIILVWVQISAYSYRQKLKNELRKSQEYFKRARHDLR